MSCAGCAQKSAIIAAEVSIVAPSTYNNVPVPTMMYGTAWKKDDTTRLVKLAVESGFTAIDTANQLIHYQEALVGDALVELEKNGVKREALFLQTKFTPTNGQDHRTPYDSQADLTTQVNQSMDSSLKHLHTDHVDSYVLHGPYHRNTLGDEDYEVWAAMEALYDAGKARALGVSNVNAKQLTDLCAKARIKPMMVQNRCYAAMGWDLHVRQICERENLIYQGFSLLTANPQVVSSRQVRDIATRLRCTTAQVIFKFAVSIGMLPLTGTTDPQHMKEDLAAQHLDLSAAEVEIVESIAA
jgi:diketogulonate reductase-like aldo/keto reductase